MSCLYYKQKRMKKASNGSIWEETGETRIGEPYNNSSSPTTEPSTEPSTEPTQTTTSVAP